MIAVVLGVQSRRQAQVPSSLSDTDPHTSLSGLLDHFSSSVNDHSDSWITVEKSKVWPRVLQFYKSAKVKHKQLRRQLCVEYVHEDGVDAGGISLKRC